MPPAVVGFWLKLSCRTCLRLASALGKAVSAAQQLLGLTELAKVS